MEELEGPYEIIFSNGERARETFGEHVLHYQAEEVFIECEDGCFYNLRHIAHMVKIKPEEAPAAEPETTP